MIVRSIEYSTTFVRQLKRLPQTVFQKAVQAEAIFRENPMHPSLRLHTLRGKLQGFWSLSISYQYRIVFEWMTTGDVMFISIGNHDIYRS